MKQYQLISIFATERHEPKKLASEIIADVIIYCSISTNRTVNFKQNDTDTPGMLIVIESERIPLFIAVHRNH